MSKQTRVAAAIKTHGDLKALQAKNPNALVVGVTSSGAIYKLEDGNAKRLDVNEAADYLKLTIEETQELSKDPKSFRFPLEAPVKEASEIVEEAIEEGQVDEVLADKKEESAVTDIQILENRVAELESTIEEILVKLDKALKRKRL